MKMLVVWVSVVLASILFSVVVIAAPPLPSDVQIIQPDPSLSKELAAFFGKWEANANWGGRSIEFFLIGEKIDEKRQAFIPGVMI